MENRGRITNDKQRKRHSFGEAHFFEETDKEHMDIIASCGKKLGVVAHVGGGAIKLTKQDSPDGKHRFIPVEWVERVDSHVHLKKNSMEAEQYWKFAATACGCSG